MKRKPHPEKPRVLKANGDAVAKGTARKVQESAGPAGYKRFWFRLVAAVLLPLLVLGVFEVVLRGVGYGHPTSYFVPAKIDGREVWVENARFGARFFPPELVRRPPPTVMSRRKTEGVIRIFLFGESAALGDPQPAYGMGRHLEVLLRERFPGTSFEVVCVAMTAINSHAILPIARECARRDGDIWVFYMGNNEMVGPFGAATIFGAQAPPLAAVRATLALRSTRLGQWLASLGRAWVPARQASWGGMEMFLEQQIGPDDPRLGTVRANFEANLEDLVRAGEKARVKLVLSTVASNLKDCPPFASLHAPQVVGQLEADWTKHYLEGQQWLRENVWSNALRAFTSAGAIDRQHAELAYHEGTCRLALNDLEGARDRLEAARDLDALPFRADSGINAMIRKVAEAHAAKGVRWVDAVAVLGDAAHIPGESTFYEHVHLNYEGNYRLARAFAAEIEAMLPEPVRRRAAPEWADAELCARRLGLTDWNREAAYAELAVRLNQPPFTSQWGHEARMARLAAEQAAMRARLTPARAVEAEALYRQAIEGSPLDPRLYANYAEFLAGRERLDDAVAQWRRVEALLPHHHVAPFFLGKLLSRRGSYDEARAWLEKCLVRQPGAVDALIELGHLESRRKRPVEAIAQYRAALALQPGNASLYVDLADAQAAAGDRVAAIESLRQAIGLQPKLWRAHYYLGIELVQLERIPEAAVAFGEVVRLNPEFALGQLNFGVALIRLGRVTEAAQRFQKTLELDPQNAKAREYLEIIRSRAPGAVAGPGDKE